MTRRINLFLFLFSVEGRQGILLSVRTLCARAITGRVTAGRAREKKAASGQHANCAARAATVTEHPNFPNHPTHLVVDNARTLRGRAEKLPPACPSAAQAAAHLHRAHVTGRARVDQNEIKATIGGRAAGCNAWLRAPSIFEIDRAHPIRRAPADAPRHRHGGVG